MRLLWIINIPLPPLCEQMGWQKPFIGGWLYSSFKQLVNQKDINLFVASPYPHGREFVDKEINGVRYFAIPYGSHSTTKTHAFVRRYWKHINEEVKPDVVHIHGTEFAHGNDYVTACGGENVVVSIQGLVSVIASYYLGGLKKWDILMNVTLRDLLRRSTIYNDRKGFVRRGKIEVDTLKRIKHVIGRTEWDKAHVWAINPDANYYHCGETLRDSFYCHKWSYEKCTPHTIFLSQSEYPIKGLQIVLAALPLVLKKFPDTKIYVAGHDLTDRNPWYRYTGYANYISNLIMKLGLSENVVFTGSLTEEEICQRYLDSNLFICSSIIENSPNSLGEAQLLGVPVLASYAGGIPDMMGGDYSNLYRYDDAELLAYKICNTFIKREKAKSLEAVREAALLRHSSQKNLGELLDIYKNKIMNIDKKNL